MSKSYKVSVIIPIYNAEKYIGQCLLSLLTQDLDDVEYVLIDDGGRRSTMEVVRKVVSVSTRSADVFIYQHSMGENRGVSASRNLGIERSNGHYLYFVDSDDICPPHALSTLYASAEAHDLDAVVGSYQLNDTIGGRLESRLLRPLLNLQASPYENMLHYRYGGSAEPWLGLNCWNCLLRRSILLINHLSFQPLSRGEDMIFIHQTMPYLRRFALLSDITYVYHYRPLSLSNFNGEVTVSEIKNLVDKNIIMGKLCASFSDTRYGQQALGEWVKYVMWDILTLARKRHSLRAALPVDYMSPLYIHPLKLQAILRLKRHRMLNLAFYLLQYVPSRLRYQLIDLANFMLKKRYAR